MRVRRLLGTRGTDQNLQTQVHTPQMSDPGQLKRSQVESTSIQTAPMGSTVTSGQRTGEVYLRLTTEQYGAPETVLNRFRDRAIARKRRLAQQSNSVRFVGSELLSPMASSALASVCGVCMCARRRNSRGWFAHRTDHPPQSTAHIVNRAS